MKYSSIHNTKNTRYFRKSGLSDAKAAVCSIDRLQPKTPTTRRKRPITPYKWLRDLISGIDIGMQVTRPDGTKYSPHLNANQHVLDAFNRKQWWNLDRLSNADFDAHFSGEKTFYFTAGKNRKVLINIDVDCKRFGTPEGAKAFCDFLSQNSFPGLYHEPSTNGRGRHGYFVLETCGIGPQYFNRLLLSRLQPHLNKLAEDFDVEFVEIKGTSPEFMWGEEFGILESYKSGMLAKLPRDVSRFEEWKTTAVVSIADLERLPQVKATKKKATQKGQVSGSITGSAVTPEELEDLPQCVDVAESLCNGNVLKTTGRHVVTAEDIGIFLLLGRAFTKCMNADGTMPRARFEKNWSTLFAEGRVSRAFCQKRFAVIRDFLSAKGLIDWEDATYVVSTRHDTSGRGLNGRACKWRFSEELMSLISGSSIDKGEGEASWVAHSANQQMLYTSFPPETNELYDFPVPIQVFQTFDHLLQGERVAKIIQEWTPETLIAA